MKSNLSILCLVASQKKVKSSENYSLVRRFSNRLILNTILPEYHCKTQELNLSD